MVRRGGHRAYREQVAREGCGSANPNSHRLANLVVGLVVEFNELSYFFHDPTHAPQDFKALKAHYEPLLPAIMGRQDLTYLLEDVLGELHLSHADVSPPTDEVPPVNVAKTGNLAADVDIQNGHFVLSKIYHTPMFGADDEAPLDAAELAAQPGDRIVSINGVDVVADKDLSSYLRETAGKLTRVCLSRSSDTKQTRCADIRPLGDDANLRFSTWLQERQELVDRLSGGRIGYIHASDTLDTGIEEFNQAKYAQHDRLGFILDVRYNSGGYAADYFIQSLTAPVLSQWKLPEDRYSKTPGAALLGPKIMVTNGYCGSGCDTYAYYFKSQGVGQTVGTPTWGGVSGSGLNPSFVDGGAISIPQYTMTDTNGNFALEGHAVQPDVWVENTVQDAQGGHDAQLETAVKLLLKQLEPNSDKGN